MTNKTRWMIGLGACVVAFAVGVFIAFAIMRRADAVRDDVAESGRIRILFDRCCPVASIEEAMAHDVWDAGSTPPKGIRMHLAAINGATYALAAVVVVLPTVLTLNRRRRGSPTPPPTVFSFRADAG
jgi:hypothetical protein